MKHARQVPARSYAAQPTIAAIVRLLKRKRGATVAEAGKALGWADATVHAIVSRGSSDRDACSFAGQNLWAAEVAAIGDDIEALLVSGNADAVTATLYDSLNYNFLRDFVPIAGIALSPLVLVVPPSFPAKTIAEFIAYAKANPRQINYGSAGVGSVAHMAGALFESEARVQMVHVPYRGLAPALTDLMGDRLQAVFSTMPPAVGHVKAGRLRALAITSTTRSETFPDLATIGDFLPGYEASITEGLSAPKGVSADVVDILNKEVMSAVADPQIKVRLTALGTVPEPMRADQYGEYLTKQTDKWAKVIRAADLKPQ